MDTVPAVVTVIEEMPSSPQPRRFASAMPEAHNLAPTSSARNSSSAHELLELGGAEGI
jgi:hypothetical protein